MEEKVPDLPKAAKKPEPKAAPPKEEPAQKDKGTLKLVLQFVIF